MKVNLPRIFKKQEERETDIETMKEIDHVPLYKKVKWIFKKEPIVGKITTPSEKIRETLNNLNDKTQIKDIPEETWKNIAEQLNTIEKEGNEFQEEPINDPLLILIREGTKDAELYENVKPGKLNIKRSDDEDVTIYLDESKIISLKWGKKRINAWIAFEREFTAYPIEVKHDSKKIRDLVEEALINRQDLEGPKIRAWGDLLLRAGAVLVGILALIYYFLPLMGVHIFEPQQTTQTPAVTTTDDTLTIDKTHLTQEQIDAIQKISQGADNG